MKEKVPMETTYSFHFKALFMYEMKRWPNLYPGNLIPILLVFEGTNIKVKQSSRGDLGVERLLHDSAPVDQSPLGFICTYTHRCVTRDMT